MLWAMVCRLLKIKSIKEWIILCLIHLFSWEKEMYFLTNGQEGSCPFYPVKKLLSGSTVWIANVEGELGETECFKWTFFSLAYSIFKGFVFCFVFFNWYKILLVGRMSQTSLEQPSRADSTVFHTQRPPST